MTDDRSILYQGAYFSLIADPVHAEFVRCGDEALVVALTADGDVLLTVEPSAAFPGPTVILKRMPGSRGLRGSLGSSPTAAETSSDPGNRAPVSRSGPRYGT